MCMSKASMFLCCLIPSPSYPKASIDVYLEPFIYCLSKEVMGWCFDMMFQGSKFYMKKAALMWIINYFPAYVLLSGLGTHGRFAFVHCMEHKKSFTLHYGRKSCWFDSL